MKTLFEIGKTVYKKLLEMSSPAAIAQPAPEDLNNHKKVYQESDKIEAQMQLPKNSPPLPVNTLDVRIGDLAAKYETSGKGVGFISTGMGGKDPGGISYGNYQLETKKGTMQAYLKSKESGTYGAALRQFTVNSTNFKNKWKQLAKDDPEGFNYSQFLYLANKPNGYNDAIKYAEKLGWNTDNFAMQSAIYSTVNQSGGWKTGIFSKAGIKKSDSLLVQLNKLYDARADYFRRIRLDPVVKRNIIKNRTVDERKDAIRLIGK